MAIIEAIRDKFTNNAFEFSKHATDQSILREITFQEIREAASQGEIIEDYPDDKYGSSCLIYGFTYAKRPIHIQCSYPAHPLIKIITVYDPSATEWIDYRIRK
jgi:hypothetical protein